MPGKTSTILKSLFVLALIGGGVWAGLRYKDEGLQAWQRFRAAKPVAIQGPPEALSLLQEPLKRAQAKGKIAVLRFNLTNCGVCERVSRDVFTKPEWGKFAEEKLEMTEYLMPTSITSEQPELVKRMQLLEALSKSSGAGQGFPFIAVLGHDGTLLGARAGYHDGGPASYIQWVESLGNADKSVASPAKTETPASTASSAGAKSASTSVTTNKMGAVTNASGAQEPPGKLEITVKGISGTGDRRMVLFAIGKRNIPLFSGEKKRVPFGQGFVEVECGEIGDKEVVVRVEGEEQERRVALKLE